jgi:hypothetical protein
MFSIAILISPQAHIPLGCLLVHLPWQIRGRKDVLLGSPYPEILPHPAIAI